MFVLYAIFDEQNTRHVQNNKDKKASSGATQLAVPGIHKRSNSNKMRTTLDDQNHYLFGDLGLLLDCAKEESLPT